MSDMLPATEVAEAMRSPGLGFERVDLIHGSTYRDCSTVIVVPTRGMIHHRVVAALQALIAPMNQKRAIIFAAGHEVGRAYDEMIGQVLANPELSRWKYILTIEDDNIVPPDAHVRLLESIDAGPFDAVGGLYFTKGEGINAPMCYGDPDEFSRTGVLDFRPRPVGDFLKGANVVPCNGIAMGCSLYRMELFRQMPAPWFVTVADVVEGGAQAFTQDLWACQRWARAGKRFAVDMRVKVGHLDVNSGVVY